MSYSFSVTGITADAHAYEVRGGGAPVSLSAALAALEGDPAFVAGLVAVLAAHPVPAYRWETPRSHAAELGEPLRFALVRDDALARLTADPSPFAPQLARGGEVVDFDNLGGDAHLIVPAPRGQAAWPHLAAFARSAPAALQLALWRRVGACWRAALAEAPAAPRWVSTAGLGVPWLHVRIDRRPKYYRHGPYRAGPA